MTDHPLLFSCVGRFSGIPFFDKSLAENFRIEDVNRRSENFRVKELKFGPFDSVRKCAVSSYSRPYGVAVYEIETRKLLFQCSGIRDSVFALGIVSAGQGDSRGPRIIAGSGGAPGIVLFSGLTGNKIADFVDAPAGALRVLHVPEWNDNEVFINSYSSVFRFDLNRLSETGERTTYVNPETLDIAANVSAGLLYAVGGRVAAFSTRDPKVPVATVAVERRAHCCSYVEERRKLVVGMDGGGIRVFDSRRLDADVLRFTISRYEILEIEKIDEDDVFLYSDSASLGIVNALTGIVLRQTSIPKRPDGICVFNSDVDDDESDECALVDRFAFLMSFEFCVFSAAVRTNSFLVTCWAWML